MTPNNRCHSKRSACYNEAISDLSDSDQGTHVSVSGEITQLGAPFVNNATGTRLRLVNIKDDTGKFTIYHADHLRMLPILKVVISKY